MIKHWLILIFVFTITIVTQAQNITIDAYKVCDVVVISEDQAYGSEYGWWSEWCKMKENKEVKQTPYSFSMVPNKHYFVIIYDAKNEVSDGVVLKGLMINDRKEQLTYKIEEKDFREWHNLSCD